MINLDEYLYAEPIECFAGLVQKMRERAGFSQRQFGKRIKKGQSEISKYERTKQLPSEKTLTAIIDDLSQSEIEAFTVRYFWRQARK